MKERRKKLLLLIGFLCTLYSSWAQGERVSLILKDETLSTAFRRIEKASHVKIQFVYADIASYKVSSRIENKNALEAVRQVIGDFPLTYAVKGNGKYIVIAREKNNETKVSQSYQVKVKGKVTDIRGNPLAGVTIALRSEDKQILATSTGADGTYFISFTTKSDSNLKLLFNAMGKAAQEVVYTDQQMINVTMSEKTEEIGEVVVTGMFERKKESFSGTSATFSGEQLRNVSTQNVIQALRSLDPSFVVVDNNLGGSNPNALANIELRGKTSLNGSVDKYGNITDQLANDPNQPLFVLDGFETTLRQITDLDVNRIASITILKDAASTALYGSRSANGVVVVETIRPKGGDLQISYTGNFAVEVPDLRDYNMMNAEQKLEYEVLAGRYSSTDGNVLLEMQRRYNQRLKGVKEGVNTYWLNVPLQTGYTQKNALYANGGSEEFQFGVGADYQNINGVMIGSGRKNWSARTDLNYRKSKWNISNRVFVSGYKSTESLYGSFKDYVQINPFFKKTSTDPYFERNSTGPLQGIVMEARNPLYNAMQNSYNFNKSLTLQNFMQFNWDMSQRLRLSGGFQLTKIFGKNVDFLSPQNTMFDQRPVLEKGRYTQSNSENLSYDGNLMLSYNRVFAEKHVITGNFHGDVSHSQGNSTGFVSIGFPVGTNGNPIFANSYQLNSKPLISMPPTTRRLNFLGSINYVFDNRYFVDATYRVDGSTVFGSNNRYSPFWSAGVGWSLAKEQFFKHIDWVDLLTLRANVGYTGNQQLGSFSSTTVYNLESITNIFGQGIYHTTLGNPELEWQKTLQTNLGLDFGINNNRFTGSINAYRKYTDPLIVNIALPGSNGVTNFPINVGSLTVKGIEAKLNYAVINKLSSRIIWNLGLTGSTYKSTYGDFSSRLNSMNESQRLSRSIIRYRDGYSPDDIWVVPSLGIDPGTGEELFLKQDGTLTYEHDFTDERVVASLRPKAEGVISSNLRIKGLTLGVYVRYRLGASVVNTALYEKVENISLENIAFNQDLRALTERWKQPGDITQFKGINLNSQTPISSRFVQKENMFSGESISVGYEFLSSRNPWLKRARMQSLRFMALMNNIFRISNITAERGINYPFANTVTLNISALF